ncbi:FAD-dependent oxidoreductase [Viridibacillus sp. NPDC093762]|uniref:FAD-dependent oxidoreductase n=1 Tax=Viridibacillus sp. NPDC093762 TaxID=3390720 RepID=UPI003D013CFF
MTKYTDVLVLGGGIIARSTTYYVSNTGLSVTVVEKGELVSGTSSRLARKLMSYWGGDWKDYNRSS